MRGSTARRCQHGGDRQVDHLARRQTEPMALGPLGRGWPQRSRFAGTYDEKWLADVFPFLLKDSDEGYYQAAPDNPQVPLPRGPMEVMLSGFTADGTRQFMLPHFE